jgi:hypothetical protein
LFTPLAGHFPREGSRPEFNKHTRDMRRSSTDFIQQILNEASANRANRP